MSADGPQFLTQSDSDTNGFPDSLFSKMFGSHTHRAEEKKDDTASKDEILQKATKELLNLWA